LNEILASEGGMALSSKMIVYLLNRIKEFNEWG
jgi:AP-4 complex subunit beta-1